jgi:hypothetical protein
MKQIDKIANLAVIVAVVVFVAVTVRREFFAKSVPQMSADPTGTTISLPEIQNSKYQNTVVLVLSTSCHFCRESLPFYVQLSQMSRGHASVLAVLPEPMKEAKDFLNVAGVSVDQIITRAPDAVGVRGTPTVLLVDPRGKVRRSWIGKLDASRQKELLDVIMHL